MAVLKGIEITIQVNGQALQEYDDTFEDEDENSRDQRDHDSMPYRMTKYVEAISGARFALNAVVRRSAKAFSNALGFVLSLDGFPVESDGTVTCMRLPKLKNRTKSISFDGSTKMAKTGTIKRPFMFSDIKWSGGPLTQSQGKEEKNSVDDLGTIVVKVWRMKLGRRTSEGNALTSFEGPLNDAEELHEKELKGKNVTHRVCLGEEEQEHQASQWWKSDYVDGVDHPFTIFTFKYCSKKALQSLLLIPRTPSPTPAPPPVPLEERPEDELTMEDLRELARRQRARFEVERKASVKFEAGIKAENGVKSEPGIKSERGVKRAHDGEVEELVVLSSAKKVKRPIANGEIVDLSD